jgi:hypothetical protein
MSTITLESLGFTQEELQKRVIDQLCDQFTSGMDYNPDDGRYPVESDFAKQLEKLVQKRIDDTINAIAEKHVLPNVAQYVDNLTLQETNNWGEKKGTQLTFTEYLIKRAEVYVQEQVDSEGKGKQESSSSYWSGKQTRITYLVNKHLQYSIETAMKQAMQEATGQIARGIHETARLKLNEIAASLKVTVKA